MTGWLKNGMILGIRNSAAEDKDVYEKVGFIFETK